MATDHEGYMSWSFHELSSCKQQSVSEVQDIPISEILDHGSISFGRYATESLVWEKWSVFSHNRCQEELEKFKTPGFVAQKKAYFEEYYKKIRAMKALQAEQPDSCQDANSSSMQVATNVNLKVSQGKKKPCCVSNITNSDSNMISKLNSSLGGTVDKSKKFAKGGDNGCSDKSSMEGKTNLSSPTSVKKASPLRTPSSQSSKSMQRSSRVSNMVNNNTNQLKKQASVQQAKGTIASIRNKTNLDSSRSTTNNVKQSAKPNFKPISTLRGKSIHKDDKSRLMSKKSGPIGNRKIPEVRTISAVLNSSLVRDKLVSPLLSTQAHQVTMNTTSKSLAVKMPIRSSVHAQSAKLVSSSSTIGACQVKTSTPASQGLVEKPPTRLRVHSPTAKSISEKTIVAGGLTNTALSKRSVDLSMLKNPNQKIGVESGQRSNVKEGMQREGKDKLSAPLGVQPKAALSARLKNDSTALAGEPTAALSARLKKDLNAALPRKPTAALSAELKKDSNAAIAREPKAALSPRLRKDSNAVLGRAPTVASSAGLRTDSKRVSSKVSNVSHARGAMLTQKIVPCRSPDLLHDRRKPTRPRPMPIWR